MSEKLAWNQKACPKCEKVVTAATMTCACGYLWPRKPKKVKATPKPVKLDDEQPEFAAALASDGSLMLIWPRVEESVTLKAAEIDLLRRVQHAAFPVERA